MSQGQGKSIARGALAQIGGGIALPNVKLSGSDYVSFTYYVSKPTRVMVGLTVGGQDMSNWIRADKAGQWVNGDDPPG